MVKKTKSKTIGGRVTRTKKGSKNLITYVDKPTIRVRRARVCEHRLARRQARQARVTGKADT